MDGRDISAGSVGMVTSYNVDAFTDPYAALRRFAEIDPMPGLNGLQLYYRFKAINHNMKIVFITALDAANELVSILPDITLDFIIRKPADPILITNTLKRFITSS